MSAAPRPPGFGAGPRDGGVAVLEVESVAAGGEGVAREPSGRVVFLPRTAPGDRVRARIVEERRRWARALPEALLAAGPERVAPPCPYYVGCGGCQVQHLALSAQRAAKGRMVADALARIGGLEVAVDPAAGVGPPFGYRNRVTFTLRRTAGEQGALASHREVRAGYHRFDRPGEILDVEDCPLAEEPVRRAWAALRNGWGDAAEALPAGPELRLTLRASAFGAVALIVRGGDPSRPGRPEPVAAAGLAAVYWTPDGSERRTLAGPRELPERWAGLDLRLRPEAFLQVNRAASDAMDAWLDDRAGELGGRRVLDLYAGVAARAIRWAQRGARVAAVEVSPDAVASGRDAAERLGVEVAFHEARVELRLERLLPADLVVVNPPRGGLSREVAGRLARGGAEALAYVSCDPATLARDLGRLGPAWRLAALRCFDAFPQTAHVETIAWLERRASSDARVHARGDADEVA